MSVNCCLLANVPAGEVYVQEAAKTGTSAPFSARAVPLNAWTSRLPTERCRA